MVTSGVFSSQPWLMAIVIFAVILSITVKLSYAEYSCHCESKNLTINCSESKIKIHGTLYGIKNDTCCPQQEYQHGAWCAYTKAIAVVKEICENKSICEVPALKEFFELDLCVKVTKYLEVEYTCEVSSNQGTVATPWANCSREVANVDGIILTFPETRSRGQIDSIERCLGGTLDSNRSLGTRHCGDYWGEAELRRECYNASTVEDSLAQIDLINITAQNVEEVAVNVFLISNQIDEITPTGLESLIKALGSVVEVGSTSEQVTASVVGVVNNLMTLQDDMLLESANVNNIVLLLESQVARVHRNGQNFTQSGMYLQVSALQLGKESLAEGFVFDDHFPGDKVNISDEEDHVRKSSLRLPPSIIDIISKVHPNISFIPITFITYLNARLFQPSFNNTEETAAPSLISAYVDSHVVTATVELDDVIIRDLPQNSSVLITFSTPTIDREVIDSNATVEFVCVYWEYVRAAGRGKWSQKGCTRVPTSTDEEILCSCNHLTSLAVLVTIHNSTVIDSSQPGHVVLQVITVVGCVISIVGLFISVVAMLAFRTVRQKQLTHVHLNLCLALLGLYLSFLLGIDRTDFPDLCKVMASVIYFFCLSSMAWMSAEAFYVYMLIWNYQRSTIEHFILVAALFAWGVPAMSSLLLYFLFDDHDYLDTDYCFLHPGYLFYFGFLLLLFLLFLYNSAVFTLATYRVSCRKIHYSNRDNRRGEIITRVKSNFLFWILLGISWLFGFLAFIPGPLNMALQVIFCTLLAFQGFFMFFMLLLQNPEMRNHCSITTAKTDKMVEETKSTPLQKGGTSVAYSADLQATSSMPRDEFYELELELRSVDCAV